jgi:nucleoside 2-deoxyribosyltransferase
MPISGFDGYSAEHWEDVLAILKDSAHAAMFDADLVSTAKDAGVIQKRIIQNLYNCDIVICDVSGKNANVMFELGLRLAFDKPTILVKDDATAYSFDTSVIEHLQYPRDLRYHSILAFKDKLAQKLGATFVAAQDPGYVSFLKNFGQYQVSKLQSQEVSLGEYIVGEIRELMRHIARPNSRPDARRKQIIEMLVVQFMTNRRLSPNDLTAYLVTDICQEVGQVLREEPDKLLPEVQEVIDKFRGAYV